MAYDWSQLIGPGAAAGATLLGGTLAGIGNEEPEVRNTSVLNDQQERLFQDLSGMARTGLRTGATPYSGTRVPGQNQLLSNYYSAAGNVPTGSLYTGASNALQTSMRGKPLYGADMDAAQKYWQSTYADPAMSTFMKDMLPKLRESYAGGTFDSGGRLRAEHDALADVATGVNANLASIMYGEHQAGQNERDLAANRALLATGQAQQLGQTPFQAGASQYQYDAAPLEEDYQNWLLQQPWANPYASTAMGLIGINTQSPYLYQESPSTLGTIGSLMGSAGSYALGNQLGRY
jgi:hypothetical protein